MEGWRQQAMSLKDLNRLVDSFVRAHSRAQRAETIAIRNQIILDTDRASHGRTNPFGQLSFAGRVD
jgi:hypothetical protein